MLISRFFNLIFGSGSNCCGGYVWNLRWVEHLTTSVESCAGPHPPARYNLKHVSAAASPTYSTCTIMRCQYTSLCFLSTANNVRRIDVSTRLRRGIVLNDILLVKRIVRNHPQWLRNPDFDDKSNTSLHLAAKYGFWDIAVRTACPA